MADTELRKEWERRIANLKASGQTHTKWCETNNVNYHQLKYWLKKIDNPSKSQETNSKWVSMIIEDELSNNKNETLKVRVGQALIEVNPDFNPTFLCLAKRWLIGCFMEQVNG
ncbi:IS66 family insertion sequence element accessory protein TnpA [Bacillus sp. 1NLA3E]|jgi:hypothetical protein|uniref:IS66 family insertion sequence element accessory protein TnpA n=1 Tax=Bacillus sp. 1NLA3E TaxID=666686 RepID=UPI0006860564|nr:hypothetical protein [Bacillus sp. 1NLA3E]